MADDNRRDDDRQRYGQGGFGQGGQAGHGEFRGREDQRFGGGASDYDREPVESGRQDEGQRYGRTYGPEYGGYGQGDYQAGYGQGGYDQGRSGQSGWSGQSYGPSYGAEHGRGPSGGQGWRGGYGQDAYNRQDYGGRSYGYQGAPAYEGESYARAGRGGQDRGWWDKTRDEVGSWFGDDDAQRRRSMDEMRAEHRGRGPKSYRRSDDRIREDVNDRLTDDPFLDASNIEVTVSEGEVTLTGTVGDRGDKRRAEDLAEHCSGVKHVQNNIRVQSSTSTGLGSTSTTSASAATEGMTQGSRSTSSRRS